MKRISLLLTLCILSGFIKSQTYSTVCAGSTVILQALNPQNLTSTSYSINPGGISNSTGIWTVTPNITTNYTLYTSGQNTASALETSSAVVTVSVLPQPFAATSVTQANCTSTVTAVNISLSFIPSIPVTAYTISWTPLPANAVSPQQTYVNALSAGPYTAIVTAAGGCATTVTFTINPQPEPATFTLNAPQTGYVINCFHPTLSVSANPPTNSYTWTSITSSPLTGTFVNLSSQNIGSWTVSMTNSSGCSATQTFALTQNTSTPISTLSSTLINITCSQSIAPSLSITVSPTVNVTQHIYAPTGGTYVANSYTAIYAPGGPGTYTHCAISNLSGCSTCKTFTVVSTQGYPTYFLNSSANFSVGCNTKSVCTTSLDGGNGFPSGNAVSYTVLAPGASTVLPNGNLSPTFVYTMNVAGTYTAIVKDNISGCITKTPFTIISNTLAPGISVTVPTQILDCTTTSVTLKAASNTQNVNYSWLYPGIPTAVVGSTLVATTNTSAPTQTLLNTYTLTVTDNTNDCKSYSVIPMYQNTFPPKAKITATGGASLTCTSPTVILLNNSSTGIPLASSFPPNSPVIAYLWEGPSVGPPIQVSSTYTAGVAGVYTLTAKDLNNGCLSKTVTTVFDNRIYPAISSPSAPFFLACPGVVTIFPTTNGPLPGGGITYTWTAPANAIVSTINSTSLTTSSPGFFTLSATNVSSGCETKVIIAVFACVGIETNVHSTESITLFPNPGNGLFTLISENLQTNSSVEIYNSTGALVKKQTLTSTETLLNIKDQANGIYIIRVIQNNKVLNVSRIVKE